MESFAHHYPVWTDRSFKNRILAFGLGGVWDARYEAFIFPNSPARIHFCFLSGHWDEFLQNEQNLWQFGNQLALARARMRLFVPDFSQLAFDSVLGSLTTDELSEIPY